MVLVRDQPAGYLRKETSVEFTKTMSSNCALFFGGGGGGGGGVGKR